VILTNGTELQYGDTTAEQGLLLGRLQQAPSACAVVLGAMPSTSASAATYSGALVAGKYSGRGTITLCARSGAATSV
jgi:hypothetical protein